MYSISNTMNVLEQLVPVTDLRRNLNGVFEKLKEKHTLYILKNTEVVSIMLDVKSLEELSERIEYLEIQNAALLAKVDPTNATKDDVLKMLQL